MEDKLWNWKFVMKYKYEFVNLIINYYQVYKIYYPLLMDNTPNEIIDPIYDEGFKLIFGRENVPVAALSRSEREHYEACLKRVRDYNAVHLQRNLQWKRAEQKVLRKGERKDVQKDEQRVLRKDEQKPHGARH